MEPSNLAEESDGNECVMKGKESGLFTDNEKEKSHIISENMKIESSLGCCNLKTQDIPLSRESPDGSSDSCEWPALSPVNHSSLLMADGSSHPSCSKLPSEPNVLHNRNIGNITGARPKEIFMTQKLRNEYIDKSDDNSGLDYSISPSLLEVHYDQESNDSNCSHSFMKSRRIRESRGFKASQVRHRSSSGKVVHAVTDSDQDSEDMAKEILSQSLRRRRRLPAIQQLSPLSVKSLVDSRGVLRNEAEHHVRKEKCGTDFRKQRNFCDNVRDYNHKASDFRDASQEMAKTDSSVVTCTSSEKCVEGLPQPSAPMPVSPSRDIVDGMASSAPTNSIKQYSASSKNRMKKKKTHGRSRSDGAQEIIRRLQLTHSNTDSELGNSASSSTRSIPVPERKRFMEDGGHSITPAADNGFFPRPQPGQSLIEFLSSKEFHKQHAALDKENAHFNISEAVIAALTQVTFLL